MEVGEEHEPRPQVARTRIPAVPSPCRRAPRTRPRRRRPRLLRLPRSRRRATTSPLPAPVSTSTWWPSVVSSRTPSGVMATRPSATLTSAGTPTIMTGPPAVPTTRLLHCFSQRGCHLLVPLPLDGCRPSTLLARSGRFAPAGSRIRWSHWPVATDPGADVPHLVRIPCHPGYRAFLPALRLTDT